MFTCYAQIKTLWLLSSHELCSHQKPSDAGTWFSVMFVCLTHVRAGSPSSCVCTACSSTPRLSAVCLCGRPPERGRLSEPELPGPPPAAPPPPPGSSGGPPDSPRSQLQHKTHTTTRCGQTVCLFLCLFVTRRPTVRLKIPKCLQKNTCSIMSGFRLHVLSFSSWAGCRAVSLVNEESAGSALSRLTGGRGQTSLFTDTAVSKWEQFKAKTMETISEHVTVQGATLDIQVKGGSLFSSRKQLYVLDTVFGSWSTF